MSVYSGLTKKYMQVLSQLDLMLCRFVTLFFEGIPLYFLSILRSFEILILPSLNLILMDIKILNRYEILSLKV